MVRTEDLSPDIKRALIQRLRFAIVPNFMIENGKVVEIWSTRQDKGTKMGFWSMKSGERTGLPVMLRFEDGKLVSRGESLSQAGFTLDN